MNIEIKNRITQKTLYSSNKSDSIRNAVYEAIRSGVDLRCADLSGADLSGANLSGADLSGAEFRGANLGGAYLVGADLSGSEFRGANLRGAYLVGADLSGANLGGANLGGADLRGSEFRGADLSGAYLSGADLSGAEFRGANYGNGIPMTLEPLQIVGLSKEGWQILIFDCHMKIGCELHSLHEWMNFDDGAINSMDRGALKFWRRYKDVIFAIIRSSGREV